MKHVPAVVRVLDVSLRSAPSCSWAACCSPPHSYPLGPDWHFPYLPYERPFEAPFELGAPLLGIR